MEENVRKVSGFGKCGKRVLAVMMIFAMAVSSGMPAGSTSGANGRTDCCTTEHIGGKKEKMFVPKENL